ncbi:sugar porter family MFS transporter [Fontisphaera persica]|uniref:sugar porter family MFS transporter n=1 Tax=Fontisphaera persica TaxID=2974023 RepID=UPI0024C07D5E|nr:sugar porter family MFS transporter [Fontisphaera persica]WCJ61179.1 sugar porter family MFS transporter [Fontisphaera persica]
MAPTTQVSQSRGYVLLVCFVAALSGLLFGYDTGVIGGAIGFMRAKFSLNPAQEGWTAASILVGCMVGVLIAGPVADRLGRKRLLVIAGLLFGISSVGTALPQTLSVFIAFRLMAGVAVGAASMAAPMYIAEIAPADWRGRLISLNQLAIVTGIFVVYFANWFIASLGDATWNQEHGWRWMFASCVLPSLLFLVLLLWVPESPRWLVKQNRPEEARVILERVNGAEAAAAELSAIHAAIQQEEPGLGQLLRPGLRRALVIGIMLAFLQQFTGINAFIYFGAEIFKSMGSSTQTALIQHVLLGGVNFLFTLVAIATVDRLGRKPLMVAGSLGMGICLFGLYFSSGAGTGAASALKLVFILGYIACFALSLGPVTWVILAEIFPTRVRGRALGLATFCLWLGDYLVTQTYPMMAENEWLQTHFRQAFPFLLYGAFCVVEVLFVLLWVPETKGKTLEQIEAGWRHQS